MFGWDFAFEVFKTSRSEWKIKKFVGFDIVFGAITGYVLIISVGHYCLSFQVERDYDGRAPLYFKNKAAMQEQMKNNKFDDCFYL